MTTPKAQQFSESRRKFLLRAAGLGGAGLSASLGLAAAKARAEGKEFRLGIMNLVKYSHLGIWGPLIEPFTGMRITHCWDIEPEIAKSVAKRYQCTAVKNFDDMLGKVDGVISGGFFNHGWNHIIHEPYLKAGLPNLINRPFSNSIEKAQQMIEMAQKHGATIICPSSFEHTNATARAKAWAKDKKITCYSATNSTDDYPTHGIHGVYFVCRAITEVGNPVVSVAYQAKEWFRHPALLTYEHRDTEGRQFFGSLHNVGATLATIRIHAPGEYGGKGFRLEPGTGYPYNKTELWAPTLWAYEAMARGDGMPQTFDQLLHKHKVFMAGFWSILKKDGLAARLDEVPGEWESPVALPNRPSEQTYKLFKKKFG